MRQSNIIAFPSAKPNPLINPFNTPALLLDADFDSADEESEQAEQFLRLMERDQ